MITRTHGPFINSIKDEKPIDMSVKGRFMSDFFSSACLIRYTNLFGHWADHNLTSERRPVNGSEKRFEKQPGILLINIPIL